MTVSRLLSGLCLVSALVLLAPVAAVAQDELTYDEYDAIAQTAHRLKHVDMYEPVEGEPGMNLVIGDKFGQIDVFYLQPGGESERVWKSRQLAGSAREVLCEDLDGDGLDDSIICRTDSGRLYVWAMDGFQLLFESLSNDYQTIHAFTVANVDDDEAREIILNADRKIHYVDGRTFSRDWTSLNEYEATRMVCGDVDGDDRNEIVLNTGQVIDSASGEVEWSDEVFGSRVELLDIDGDGILEILTESDGLPLRVWDVDYRSEKRFQ